MKDRQIEIPQHKRAKTPERNLILDQVQALHHLLQILVQAVLKKDRERKNQKALSCMMIT